MNMKELVTTMRLNKALSQADARMALTGFTIALSNLKKDENLVIQGFGTFYVKRSTARKGRNPRTGEAVDIPATLSLKFKQSPAAKAALNSGA